MSKESKRKTTGYVLLAGVMFLTLGIATDKVLFTWTSILLVLVSLMLSGSWKWLKKR